MRFITLLLMLIVPLFGSSGYEYPTPITSQDRQDVAYIIRTLANTSTPMLLFKKKSLNAAGDRVRPLHTLQFLECIFANSQLKADMAKIQRKKMPWNELMKGIRQGLNNADREGSLAKPQIDAFAKAVGINPEKIYPLIQAKKWDAFVNAMIYN